MFKLVEERRTWQVVTYPYLDEEGKRVEAQIDMQFVLHTADENIRLLREARELDQAILVNLEAGEDDPAKRKSALAARFGMQFIRDWKRVVEANDDPIKFSEEALARLFNVQGMYDAVLDAYRAALAGGRDARQGN